MGMWLVGDTSFTMAKTIRGKGDLAEKFKCLILIGS